MEELKNKKKSRTVEVSGHDILPYILELTQYFEEKGIEVKPYPKLVISKENTLTENLLGKTAFYDPNNQSITLYTEGRAGKDVIRSYSHELFHHHQNLRGDLQEAGETNGDPQYTQNNKHLRKIEAEAYMHGNLLFRDFEDGLKNKKK